MLYYMQRNVLLRLYHTTLLILSANPPQITQHPKHQSVCTGADVAFTVEATGDDLQFQWQKDGKDIDRNMPRLQYTKTDKSSILNISCVEESDKGHYRCLVTNPVGKTLSAAELTVREFSHVAIRLFLSVCVVWCK